MIGDYRNRFRQGTTGFGWFLGLQRLYEAFQRSPQFAPPKMVLPWNHEDEIALNEWIKQYRKKSQRKSG